MFRAKQPTTTGDHYNNYKIMKAANMDIIIGPRQKKKQGTTTTVKIDKKNYHDITGEEYHHISGRLS